MDVDKMLVGSEAMVESSRRIPALAVTVGEERGLKSTTDLGGTRIAASCSFLNAPSIFGSLACMS